MRDHGERSARRRLGIATLAATIALAGTLAPATARAADPDAGRAAAPLVAPLAGTPAGTRVTLEGTVRVVIADDFEHGTSETSYSLETEAGRVRLVVPHGTVPDLAGRGAEVTGTLLPNGAVRVEDTVPIDDAGTGAGTGAGMGPAAGGPAARAPHLRTDAVYGWEGPAVREVAVVVARYSDDPAYNGTPAEIAEAMTGAGASVREFFETASRGRVSVDATVLGPWALPVHSCAEFDMFGPTVDAVSARASDEGVDLARFDHVVMWTPAPCGSGWVARGEAPGQFIHMSAPYPDDGGRLDEFANVAAHEMGHNMGLLHANGLACVDGDGDPVALSDECGEGITYGDPFSTMGGNQGFWDGLEVHFLSPLYASAELAHLGWLDSDEEQVVTTAGSYDLVSTYAAADGVRLLRIRRNAPPVAVDRSMNYPLRTGWLTLELRSDPPDGPFDSLIAGSRSTAGVIVRYVEDGYDPFEIGYLTALGSTYLVDSVPGTVGTEMWDPELHDAPLAVGETLVDGLTGTEITLSSLAGGVATVAIAFPDGPPPAAPVIAAPVITGAVAGDETATVTWNAPSTNGTGPGKYRVEGYTVRSYPGGRVCFSIPGLDPRSCTVGGLANGTAYRFTVTAETNGGYWQMSLPSSAVTPVGPPKARIVPLRTFLTGQGVEVRWLGHDDGEPVDSTDVRYRAARWDGGFPSPTTWRSATTDTTATLTGSIGRTYCFSARSRNDGVTGPWSAESCTAVPLDDRSLRAGSTWNEVSGGSLYRGTGLRSSRQGAAASKANVEARQVALVVSTCPSCGKVKVYWNGRLEATVNLRSATSRHRVLKPVLSFSGVRTGTLRLVVSTSGKRVQLDGVAVSRK